MINRELRRQIRVLLERGFTPEQAAWLIPCSRKIVYKVLGVAPERPKHSNSFKSNELEVKEEKSI